jgi:RND family efflux transporter MFP subunit
MPRRSAWLIALTLPLLAACRAEPSPAQAAAPDPARPVQVAEVRLSPGEAVSTHTGIVRARREVDVGFRTGGRIANRVVEVGDRVQTGQELFRLDPADLTLSLRAAEADLAAAEATARQSAADAARSATLRAQGHVSASFDDQRHAAARSAAERMAAARAALDLARNRQGYTVLRAPGPGIVTALLAEAGQVVTEGQPVLRLADPSERELLVRVPESALPSLAEAAAEARFWARSDTVLPTVLREVSPQADPVLRTYAVRFALPQAPDWVALGMTGTVRLARAAEPVATLPLSALHDRGKGPMVWRVGEGGKLDAVRVEVRRLGDTTAEVAGALSAGDHVVALGPQLLDPGSRVRVVQTRLAADLR